MVWPFSRRQPVLQTQFSNGYPPGQIDPTLIPKKGDSIYGTGGLVKKQGRSFRTISLTIGIFLCFLAVLLPTPCDDTYLPAMMQLAVHQKMVAAYVLGLLTMGIVAYQ